MYLSKKVTILFLSLFVSCYPLHSMEERENKEQSFNFSYGVFSSIGGPFARYKKMEDTYTIQHPLNNQAEQALFCIFDGHGGSEVSEFARDNIVDCIHSVNSNDYQEKLKLGLKHLNEKIKKSISIKNNTTIGSCALIALLDRMNLYIAHLGDSRAIASKNGKAIALTKDHNLALMSEMRRIRKLTIDGRPIRTDGSRICGPHSMSLGMSRSLGDFAFIPYGMIDEADVLHVPFSENDFYILASDGVFEVDHNRERFKFQDAVNVVAKALRQSENDPEFAAKMLVSRAIDNGSGDNITAIVIMPLKHSSTLNC